MISSYDLNESILKLPIYRSSRFYHDLQLIHDDCVNEINDFEADNGINNCVNKSGQDDADNSDNESRQDDADNSNSFGHRSCTAAD